MINRKAQTSLEVSFLIAIVATSLVAMIGVFKSSIMGSWFSSSKQLGDPYNPQGTTGTITHKLISNTTTNVNTLVNGTSATTLRIDTGDSTETKDGTLTVSTN